MSERLPAVTVLLALVPLVLTLGLLATRLPAWVAPAAGTLAAVVVGLLAFGTEPGALAAEVAHGVPTLIEIVAIIGGGITLARVMELTGAHERLGRWLSAGTGPTLATALLMVHGVIPFLETVTGFGVSLIVGVPLLVALGFTAYRAAVMSVLALTIGAWGSMAPGTLLGAQLGDLDFRQLGITSACWNVVPGIAAGVVTVLLLRGAPGLGGARPGRGVRQAGGAEDDDGGAARPAPARLWPWLLIGAASGLAQTGLILVANVLLGTPPAGAVGTLVLTVLWLAIVRRGRLMSGPGRDVVPYLVLLAGTVLGTTADALLPLGAAGVVVGSPALWSFLASFVGARILGLTRDAARRLPREAGALWLSTALPTTLYVALGLTLTAAGASGVLAGALSGLGPGYLVAAPFIGGAGGYITASNTGSMAMFGTLQMQTGAALGVPPVWMNGLHNASSGWGIIASPARVQVAYSMAQGLQRVGMPGLAVSRRSILAVLGPTAFVSLAIMAAVAPFALPRG